MSIVKELMDICTSVVISSGAVIVEQSGSSPEPSEKLKMFFDKHGYYKTSHSRNVERESYELVFKPKLIRDLLGKDDPS
jgi:hypothetical protein